jgi:PAS domain S-box-containing protein
MPGIAHQLFEDSPVLHVRGVTLNATDDLSSHQEKVSRILLDEMYQFVGLLDSDGNVIDMNRPSLDGAGIRLDDIQGKPFWDARWWAVSQEGRNLVQDCVRRAREGEFTRCDVEIYGRDQGRKTIIVDFSLVPIRDDSGKIRFLLAEGRNISDRVRAEADIAIKNEELQRLRLARELHDTTAQSLAVLCWNLSFVSQSADVLNPGAREALAESATLARQCLQEIRTVSYQLQPLELDELGLEPALSRYVDGFTRRSGIEVEVEVAPDLGRLPEAIETTVFRLVQECLTNIHRHSGSSTARIRLIRGPSNLVLEVEDAGHGIRDDAPTGVGVTSMRERVRQLNGGLEIVTHPGGTTVKVTIPLAASA